MKNRVIGIIVQVMGLMFFFAGLGQGDSSAVILGLLMMMVGLIIHFVGALSIRVFLKDWCGLLLGYFALSSVVAVLVCFFDTQNTTQPQALYAMIFLIAGTFGLFKLYGRVGRWAKGKEAAGTQAGQNSRQASARANQGRPAAPAPVQKPAPTPEQTSSALKKREDELKVLADMLTEEQELQEQPTSQEEQEQQAARRYAGAASQEELYDMIDDEAASIAPKEGEIYTGPGQRMLLDAAERAVPMLAMLRYPGFSGELLVNAADGAAAYEAMKRLVEDMRGLLGGMSREELCAGANGLSQSEALLAWKAFRFYSQTADGQGAFDTVLFLLSDKV